MINKHLKVIRAPHLYCFDLRWLVEKLVGQYVLSELKIFTIRIFLQSKRFTAQLRENWSQTMFCHQTVDFLLYFVCVYHILKQNCWNIQIVQYLSKLKCSNTFPEYSSESSTRTSLSCVSWISKPQSSGRSELNFSKLLNIFYEVFAAYASS